MPDYAVKTAFTAVDKMSPVLNKMSTATDKFERKTSAVFSGVAGALGAVGGLTLAAMGIKKIVSEAANAENSISSFTTLLGGSEEAAKGLVKELQILGARTPFEFKDLSDATSMLMGFGVVTKDTAGAALSMLGDLAQGSAEKLKGISLVYGQIMAGGKMMGQDFNQLINQQVPIAQGLAKVWGVDVNTAIKKIKSGSGVMASDVQKAMQLMTAEGGLFYKGMDRASATLTGRWSTFMDALSMTAATIGTVLMPAMKSGLDVAISAMETLMEIVKNNTGLIENLVSAIPYIIGAFIAWKVAVLATAAAQKVLIAVDMIKYLFSMRKIMLASIKAQGLYNFLLKGTKVHTIAAAIATKLYGLTLVAAKIKIAAVAVATKAWTAAQWLVNAAMTANPIGIVIVAIAALIGYVAIAITHWETFGKTMLNSLGPIGQVVTMLKELYDNWDKIDSAFTEAGFMAGMKAVGEVSARAQGLGPLLDQQKQAPNAAATGGGVSMQGEINITGAPAGSTASAKTRGPGSINMNMVGANP